MPIAMQAINLIDRSIPEIPETKSIVYIKEMIEKYKWVLIIDTTEKFLGVGTLEKLQEKRNEGIAEDKIKVEDLIDSSIPKVKPSDCLEDIVSIFERRKDIDLIPIVEYMSGHLMGAVTRTSIKINLGKLLPL